MDFDYNYFTKAELVDFLNEHGDDFKYMTKPYTVILQNKIEDTHMQVDVLLKENHNLLEILKDESISNVERMEASIKLSENHKRFSLLNKNLDKLSEKAYGS